eukprot:CAMPEP_0184738830 /NCGR_PEP_ID=MMETSP0315-20130426/1534_1 /TAXON_ID=101924 /ORGANISM="Rhodosorus marinus, Strain UTEX LB 2760" /LENGTH=50 /DNA_ID=CAMNT_0027206909 /DNA_START=379 /DNA_END=528 /DNA_ORIENTATION=-
MGELFRACPGEMGAVARECWKYSRHGWKITKPRVQGEIQQVAEAKDPFRF